MATLGGLSASLGMEVAVAGTGDVAVSPAFLHRLAMAVETTDLSPFDAADALSQHQGGGPWACGACTFLNTTEGWTTVKFVSQSADCVFSV
jgi:hypothetical protein